MIAQQKVLKRSREEAERIAVEELGKVGLADRVDFMPSQLSGGQQQRVAIARPGHEPARHASTRRRVHSTPSSCATCWRHARLGSRGMTMIVVTHEMQFARDVADRVVFMDGALSWSKGLPSRCSTIRNRNEPRISSAISRRRTSIPCMCPERPGTFDIMGRVLERSEAFHVAGHHLSRKADAGGS